MNKEELVVEVNKILDERNKSSAFAWVFGPPIAAFCVSMTFIIIFFGAINLNGWYISSLQSHIDTAWYEWPWHWPGAHITAEISEALNSKRSFTADLDNFPGMIANSLLALIAGLINLLIATLPIFLLSTLYSIVRFAIRYRGKKIIAH